MYAKKWIENNFYITLIDNSITKSRIKYLEIVADKIYHEYDNYFIFKETINTVSLADLIKNEKILTNEHEIVFDNKENFVEYLYSQLSKIDEYLSVNLINWFYDYENKFLINTKQTCYKIICDLMYLFPTIDLPNITKELFLIEYIDYYLSDFLANKNLNYLESSLMYELKNSILALLSTYAVKEAFFETKDDIKELGNPIKFYSELYSVNIIDILNKLYI